MPLLIFAGVGGGAGTSTVAAATALRLAERGQRTLFLSLQPRNLLIADGDRAAAQAQPASVAAGLDALGLDPQSLLAQAWDGAEDAISGLLQRGGLELVAEAELPTLPGVTDLLSVLAIGRLLDSARWDAIVLDGGESAAALQLIALPEAARWYLRRMLPLRLGLAKGLRPLAAAARLSDELATAASRLSAETTNVRLVLAPRRAAVAQARAQVAGWALHGHLVREVIANGVLGPPGTSPGSEDGVGRWPSAWVAEHAAQVTALGTLAAEPGLMARLRVVPQALAPIDAADPLTSLADVGVALYGPRPGSDPIPLLSQPLVSQPSLSQPSLRPGMAVRDLSTPDSPRYELSLALPLAEPDQVAASRSGSDLVVTVAGRRRLLTLPSVLQRCRVVSGRFTGGQLVLAFEPDERQWPRR